MQNREKSKNAVRVEFSPAQMAVIRQLVQKTGGSPGEITHALAMRALSTNPVISDEDPSVELRADLWKYVHQHRLPSMLWRWLPSA